MFELTKKSVLRTAIFFVVIMAVYPLICLLTSQMLFHTSFSYNMIDIRACVNISFAYFAIESFVNVLTVRSRKNKTVKR